MEDGGHIRADPRYYVGVAFVGLETWERWRGSRVAERPRMDADGSYVLGD